MEGASKSNQQISCQQQNKASNVRNYRYSDRGINMKFGST
jgi:hypothetical protein